MGEVRPYQRCTQCVMDTTDSKIVFDEKGVCDHCRNFEKNIKPYWRPQENRFDELEEIAKKSVKLEKGRIMIVFLDFLEEPTVHIWHILRRRLCI